MNEDYLWDKSGEPDPEIERLENALASLRFKRPIEPLPLPAHPRWSFRLSFSPMLAVAATLLILILAGGLWLGLRRSGSQGGNDVATKNPANEVKAGEQVTSGVRPSIDPETPTNNKARQDEKLTASAAADTIVPHSVSPRRQTAPRQVLAKLPKTNAINNPRREQLARQGEQAKAQLILALHIASDKLNTVQKKIQANPGT
jgi:hypothetical protein